MLVNNHHGNHQQHSITIFQIKKNPHTSYELFAEITGEEDE